METFPFAMEGSDPRSESHSRSAPPPRSFAAAAYSNNVCTNGGGSRANTFTAHDNDFGTPPSERYSKIFESFRSGKACSIPMLDLPPFDDSGAAAFDLVYSDIFGGFDLPDFALSLDDLIRRSDGRKESSESDTRTQIGTKSVSEESDPSACTGRDQYFPNGDFHQTADDKFNLSYHKVNMVTSEDSDVIHVAKHSPVLGNSYIHEGSTLLKEDGGRYSSGFDDNIILCEDSSGISVDAQSKSESNLSHDNGGKNGRPHGIINHSQTVVSDSDIYLNMDRSHVLRTSSEPPTASVMNNDPFSSMSDSKCPKGNASKALFDISSLDFLNAELSADSYGIASAAATKEAMETAKIKLKSARESTERKKDSAKGTRTFMKNDMNANGKMRMVFDDSILRDCEQVKSGRKEEQQSNVFSKKGSDSLKLGRSDNADEIEDEETEKEMKMPVLTSESENSRSTYEDSAINEEQKMDKVDLYAELKSTEQYSYKGRHLNAQSESSTSSTGSYPLYATNNTVPEMTCECEDLKFSKLAARLDEKNIATEDVETTGQFRRKEEFERTHLREHELERERERDRDLEKERIRQLAKEREQEREKNAKFHLQRLEELRERKRETEVDKDCLRKLEEERRGERERTLQKKNIGKLDVEWERDREREKDRMVGKLKTSAAHKRVSIEADEMTEQAAAEIATAETRQRSVAEARERLEKACAVAREKYLSEKASTESQLRAERAAVARATAEARERAIEKAMAERDSFEAPEQVARSASEKFSSSLENRELRHTSSSSDLWNSDMTDEVEGESADKGRAKLERHRRTVERVAKALAEKSTRDLIAQKEHAERNRLAESLDADIKRWSNGKEGNLRALLSTLQYILGPDSGWHPIPLTEIISSAAVKKAYRKATLCVHPDKLQQRGASTQQKYICEKVFDLLKDSWNRFNSEER